MFRCDICKGCLIDARRLDGGELSMLQLQYEISGKGREENMRRERFTEMSPARKARMKAQIEQLPQIEEDVLAAFCSGVVEGFFFGTWRAMR